MAGFEIGAAAGTAFLITGISGKWLIPFLRRVHFGQTILEDGPKWHKKKQGTPTMGGIMFILGITARFLSPSIILMETRTNRFWSR